MNIDTDWPVSARDLALREPRHARTILAGLALSLLGISAAVVLFGRNAPTVVAEGRSREAETYPLAFLGLSTLTFVVVFAVFLIARRYITVHQRKERELESARVCAEAADSQKAALLAWATREIRGPMTTILGQCDASNCGESAREIIRGNAIKIVEVLDAMLGSDSPGGAVLSHCTPASESDARPPAIKGRVLLADDSSDNRTVIEHYLREAGVEVTTVGDGNAAYLAAIRTAARREPFDLILMDMRMPHPDGCTTTQLLRDSKYTGPIVALTANATERDRMRCYTSGHNGFLTKPINPNMFAKMLVKYLGQNQPISETTRLVSPSLANPKFIALRDAFCRELPSRIEAIDNAIAAADISGALELAHQLKGSSGCYGLMAIHEAARDFEAAANLPQNAQSIEKAAAALRDLCTGKLSSQAA
jgi:CheY-like chemotaxis protein/HPt (histidine-containing phosphotransfer) domain-containing protein